jgi:hypothetical protein
VRYIESIQSLLELQAAGLVAPTASAAGLARSKAAFVAAFGGGVASPYVGWVGCDRVVDGVSACDGAGGEAYRRPVDLGFLPTEALAAALDMRAEGPAAALERFDAAREAARFAPGRFRTNLVPLEAINVTLWRASSRWANRTSGGFARRAADSGGDWQIFAPSEAQDGYGQWGRTEENGGVILATSALAFAAGVYPAMASDFLSIARAVDAMGSQLAQGSAGTASPLLAGRREYLRAPIAAASVPATLCRAARRLTPSHDPADRWGERWCDFYKSVSWNLPSSGAFVYAFAKGLLRLEVAIGGGVTVYGVALKLDAPPTRVPLPEWAARRWPAELRAPANRTLAIDRRNVAAAARTLSCDVDGDGESAAPRALLCVLRS